MKNFFAIVSAAISIVTLFAVQANAMMDFEKITKKVFLDIEIEGGESGRITIGLFGITAPRTTDNFRALCTGEKGIGKEGKPLHYKGAIFHRVVPKFMMQGGDITDNNGDGGESIYGKYFEDEHFALKHHGPMYVSMSNSGPNTNNSQFFITFKKAPWLDGKHVIFGKVIEGEKIVRLVEKEGNKKDGVPKSKITIVDSGELEDVQLGY